MQPSEGRLRFVIYLKAIIALVEFSTFFNKN